MSNVVDLRPAPVSEDEGTWFCPCGSYSFRLTDECVAVCLVCGSRCEGIWAHLPRDMDEPLAPAPAGALQVKHLVDPEIALRFALSKISVDTTRAVIVLQEDGSMSTWGDNFDDPERAKWLEATLQEAQRLICAKR